MFKKFFRKVRDVVKKAAPIAGIAALGMGGLGMLGGGGGGISNLLPNLIGNFASSSAKAGAGAKGSGILGALQTGGKFLGGLGRSLIGPGGTGTAAGGIASTLIPAIGSYFAYKADKPQPVDTNPFGPVDKKYNSQYGTGGRTDVLVKKTMYNPSDGKYYDAVNADGVFYNYGNEPENQPRPSDRLAQGGIVGLTMATGGEAYPRKQGMIRGPGGPKEDLIPAKLSNGEFVFTAKAVKNAGGPRAMYDMMNKLDPESSKGPRA
tara:strand:- start:3651 stop:4439 length:789 start_codon:yes stop_codon:yes gene_type:complete